ncbi:MAG: nucleotidyltransferase family protein [Candidatus Nanopelagicales bacterium]
MRGAVAATAQLLAREDSVQPPDWSSEWLQLDDPAAMLDRIRRHKLAIAVLPIAASLPLTDQQRSDLAASARAHRMRSLAVAADQVAAVRALAEEGVRVISLKGLAFAAQTTGDFGARVAGDIDLLVDPADVAAATAALQRAGVRLDTEYCPSPESPLFAATRRSLKASLLHTAHTDLDLHWRLDVSAKCCAAPFDELWSRSVVVDVGGQPVRTLGVVDAAIFCASHGTTDHWSRLRQVVDQVRIDRLAPEPRVAPAAQGMGAHLRYQVARAVVAPVVGATPVVGRRARAVAASAWRSLAAGHDVRTGTEASAVSRRLVVQLGAAYDTPVATAERLLSAGWPVQDMGARRLGAFGDRAPGLYLVWGIARAPARLREKLA